ncbi:TPA: DegT/DnrJ/EryC1/StrS family aminotransferase [Stenotrophomonas maltophilia]
MTGRELEHIAQAHANGHLSGDGPFTKQCHAWLNQRTGASASLLTHSCTSALEMAALLLELVPGDEVIMPSYTFVYLRIHVQCLCAAGRGAGLRRHPGRHAQHR